MKIKNKNDRTSVREYYTPGVEIKDVNVLIDGKSFFDVPIQNKKESNEKIFEMSKNSDYATGNLLDYNYFSNSCKLITIDLTKQIELENPDSKQQINFIGRLKQDNGVTMSFITEKAEEITHFSQNSVKFFF